MIKNSGASISKITVCINDNTLITIMKNLYNLMAPKLIAMGNINNDSQKLNLVKKGETLITIEKENESRAQLCIQHMKRFHNRTNSYLLYREEIPPFIDKDMIETFYKSIDGKLTLSKYLKIKTQTTERGRKEVYDGISDNETQQSILYEFDVEQYEQYTNQNNGLDYVLPLIKIILFLEIKSIFPRIEDEPFMNNEDLMTEINNKVNNAIVTSCKITDALKSTQFMYEDYFYELAQIKTEKHHICKITNHNRQKITFKKEAYKRYRKPETQEETINRICKQAERRRKHDEAELELLHQEEYELAMETGAAEKHGLDADEWFNGYDGDDYLGTIDDYEEQTAIHNQKMLDKTLKLEKTAIFSNNNPADDTINICFEIQGQDRINGLLYNDEWIDDSKQAKPAGETISRLLKDVQTIFDSCLYSFFIDFDISKCSNINKTYFSTITKYIKDECITSKQNKTSKRRKQENIVPKIILSIFMCNNKTIKKDILRFFEPKQRKELNRITAELKSKMNNANRSPNALAGMYKYVEERLDVK